MTPLVVAWVFRILRQNDLMRRDAEEALAAERTARIRSQERTEMAAHLHDSVLQTLALIQHKASDAARVTALARHQERDLRRWLNEVTPISEAESLVQAVLDAGSDIEAEHGVTIETVSAGDAPLNEQSAVLAVAAREALINAAKFAGTDRINVFVEVESERMTVTVRDRGPGFDPEAIDLDRRGLRESIVGRVERGGGTVSIRTNRGSGTEIEMTVPSRSDHE